MDIKSKKSNWKKVVSWLSFFFGVNILTLSLVMGASAAANVNPYLGFSLSDTLTDDYQDTKVFRDSVQSYLETFLSLAAGKEVSWYRDEETSAFYYNNYSSGISFPSADAAVTSSETESDPDDFDFSQSAEEYSAPPAALSPETAKKIESAMSGDKNVLYRIGYEGKELYTNDTENIFDGSADNLPEGYNFFLYFDGTKAMIVKDGKTVDIYGDGSYTRDSDWCLPGYKNFSTDKVLQKAVVRMAVIQKPVPYVQTSLSDNGYNFHNNQMYRLYSDLARTRNLYKSWGFFTLLDVLLLAYYIRQREQKKAADRLIARLTGKLWIECKIALVLLLLAVFLYDQRYLLETSFGGGYYDFSELIYNWMYLPAENVGGFLLFIWFAYLIVNDIRYNRKTPMKSLCRNIVEIYQEKDAKLAFQRQPAMLFMPVFFAEAALAALSALIILAASIRLYSEGGNCFVMLLPAIPLLVLIAVLLGMQKLCAQKNRDLARDMGALVTQIHEIHGGNITVELNLPEDSELYEAAEHLNDIQHGMDQALRERMKSEQMKVELVSNVSHDLKTPLTSIISYVELLKQEEETLPDDVRDYIRILDTKSQRLKSMVQDVFEISKAASGQLPVHLEDLDLAKLLHQTLADMEEQIQKSTVTLKSEIPAGKVMIHADGSRLYRVFQNLLQNALNYSLDGTRVFVKLKAEDGLAVSSIKNISRDELSVDMDFTERFIRGDKSRTDGGSGLGLSIAKSFTEACGGTFRAKTDADLFTVTVEFPIQPID